MIAVKNNKTVHYNTTTLIITVIDHVRNTVHEVSPTEDWAWWEALCINYFE